MSAAPGNLSGERGTTHILYAAQIKCQALCSASYESKESTECGTNRAWWIVVLIPRRNFLIKLHALITAAFPCDFAPELLHRLDQYAPSTSRHDLGLIYQAEIHDTSHSKLYFSYVKRNSEIIFPFLEFAYVSSVLKLPTERLNFTVLWKKGS